MTMMTQQLCELSFSKDFVEDESILLWSLLRIVIVPWLSIVNMSDIEVTNEAQNMSFVDSDEMLWHFMRTTKLCRENLDMMKTCCFFIQMHGTENLRAKPNTAANELMKDPELDFEDIVKKSKVIISTANSLFGPLHRLRPFKKARSLLKQAENIAWVSTEYRTVAS